MTREEIQPILLRKSAEVINLLTNKGADYATDDDVFMNYTLSASIAGITTQQSMVARIGEKVIRVGNLINSIDPPKVNESIEETLRDIEGISLLLRVYLQTLKEEFQEEIAFDNYVTEEQNKPTLVKKILSLAGKG